MQLGEQLRKSEEHGASSLMSLPMAKLPEKEVIACGACEDSDCDDCDTIQIRRKTTVCTHTNCGCGEAPDVAPSAINATEWPALERGVGSLGKKEKGQPHFKAEPVPEICDEFEFVESDAENVPDLEVSSDEEDVGKPEVFEIPEEAEPEEESETISQWLKNVVELQKKKTRT